MTILNVSLCLPELDIIALREKRSIVAVTQRFIVPDRSFALLPCRASSDAVDSLYHRQAVTSLESEMLPSSEPLKVTHWAQCAFCQQVDESVIATLSDLTIWTKDSLLERLQKGSLFFSLLRTYALAEAFAVEAEPVCEQLYKFIPLSKYLEVSADLPTYNDEEFADAKQAILEPKIDETERLVDIQQKEKVTEAESILDSHSWIEQISAIGHSSNGHDFEKLVRKGVMLLGFTNSLDQATASLDPNATGGAGGIDFYADYPYSIMGECKATSKDKVGRAISFYSKEPFERIKAKLAEPLSLSHVIEFVVTVEVQRKVPSHSKHLRQLIHANARSVFTLRHIAHMVDFVLHPPIASNSFGKSFC